MKQNNSFVENREVRIFISSTFSDMNGNRDEIVNKLIPYLRYRYENQNIVINAIDLRWGITDDDVLKGNVMDICLREIDKCRPFFIGIIGNRYGSSIPLSQLQDNPRIKAFYESIKDNYFAYDLSATELEMQYAVLQNTSYNRMDSFFLIKDEKYSKWSIKEIIRRIRGKKDDEVWKIRNLKNKINNSKDSGIRTFRYNNFSSTLIDLEDAISTQIDRYFKDVAWNTSDIILAHQHSQTRKLFSVKYPENEDYECLNNFVLNGEKQILAIYSEDERRNILLANWIEKNKTGFKIISYFPISSHNHKNAYTPGEYLYYVLSEDPNSCKDNIPNRPDEKLKIWELVESSIRDYINHDKLVVILPNVDDTENLEHYILNIVKKLKRCINKDSLKIVVSYRKASKIERLLNDDSVVLCDINSFTKEEKKKMIASYLQIYGKQNGLTKEPYESILNLDIPIKEMASVLDYLATHSTKDRLKDDVHEIVDYINSQHDIYDYLLDKIEESLPPSERIDIKRALSLICISYNGISETVIEDMCENLNILEIIKIENTFSYQLIHTQGKVVILNRDFANTIKKRYLTGVKEKELREIIVKYYLGRTFYSAYDELLFQYTKLQDEAGLYNLIAKNKSAITYFIENRPLDYAEAWDTLWAMEKEHHTTSTLISTFSSLTNDKDVVACNHLSYFVKFYCSDNNTAYLLANKCSCYFSKTKEKVFLVPLAKFTEAQLLCSEKTKESIQKALSIIEEAIKEFEGSVAVLKSVNNNGLTILAEKKLADMEDLHSQLLQDVNKPIEEHLSNKDLIYANSIHEKAIYTFSLSHNPQLVLPLYQEAMRIREKNGADRSILSESYSQIGYCHYLLGDYNDAITNLEHACEYIRSSKGEFHHSLRNSLAFLSFCYMQTDVSDKAIDIMKQIETIELHNNLPNQELIDSVNGFIDSVREVSQEKKQVREKLLNTINSILEKNNEQKN